MNSSITSSIVSSELTFRGGAGPVPLTIRPSARARRMSLRVDPHTGAVLLTLPPRASRRRALVWAEAQRAWIERQLTAIPVHVSLEPSSVIPLYGVPHRIDWSPGHSRVVTVGDSVIRLGGPEEALEARLLRWLRAHAHDVLERETRAVAADAGVTVARVSVGDPRSRWGSCASSGAIRYSWRLILAPEFVRRATVAHEVAHRVHMDHSPRFHALVERLLGCDPAPARGWLRREGVSLHRFGR